MRKCVFGRFISLKCANLGYPPIQNKFPYNLFKSLNLGYGFANKSEQNSHNFQMKNTTPNE